MSHYIVSAVSRVHAWELQRHHIATGWSFYADFCGRVQLFRNTKNSFDILTIFYPEEVVK